MSVIRTSAAVLKNTNYTAVHFGSTYRSAHRSAHLFQSGLCGILKKKRLERAGHEGEEEAGGGRRGMTWGLRIIIEVAVSTST